MPLAPNPFLQAAATAKSKVDLASSQPTPAAQPKDTASSFAQVYKDTQGKPAKAADAPVKSIPAGGAAAPAKKDAVANGKDDAAKPTVADSGNSLPDNTAADATASSDAAQAGGGDQAGTRDSNQDTTSTTPATDAAPVDPTVDPALIQAAATPPTPVPDTPPAPAVAPLPQPVVEAPQAAAATAAPVQAATTPSNAADDFDPTSDPLDNLPAVRLAMEQSGHVSAASQPATSQPATSQPATSKTTGSADQDSSLAQNLASSVNLLVEPKTDAGTTEQGGEKSFKGLIEDGLKDLKSASSDTRVDDFANRLAALTQAAVPKTANALPVNQPLAMHQSGWTEELVNRVMYLSSANLKSADIQLEPAELGRLDIKVNMSADQATQINFISGHAGVRDALEGNLFRLRELFQQQGLGQADVSVSDQSRGWTGQGQDPQQQQQQAQKGGNRGGARAEGEGDDLSIAAAGEAAAAAANTSVVVGSSAVDYYA